MTKRVLAIYYTQTGQLGDMMDHFTTPLKDAGHLVETVIIRPVTPYTFPWTVSGFFSVMPDCVLSVPTELEPFTIGESGYDLIVLGYQAWFLSPCIPINSLLRQPAFTALLEKTPVITITGGRNMWLNAYDGLRKALDERGAQLVGNIAMMDRHLNLVSFVTIFHWMFHGKKDRYLSIFPKPGVSETDIRNMADFGKMILPYLTLGEWGGLERSLVSAGAAEVKDHLMLIEYNGKKMFRVWAAVIAGKQNKRPWLTAFKYYLIVALFLLGPVAYVLVKIILKPLFFKRFTAKKHYYLYQN